jgi:TP901-1 family phage major tail protein
MAQTTGIINGTDLVVFVHNGGSAGTIADYTAIAHLQDCSVSPSRGTRDISTKDSAGNAEHLPAQKSWTASASGLYAQDAAYGYTALFAKFDAGTMVTLMIGDPTDAANLVHKGDAYLTSMPLTAPTEDNATYSVEFQGTAALSYGAASTLF